ncbi:MAG: carbohydrate porin [bacterium]|nr:carbohydrate porin [bacterium]
MLNLPKHLLTLVFTVSLLVLTSRVALATDSEETGPQNRPASKSGFGELPSIGGPNGVAAELSKQDEMREFRYTVLHDLLRPWFDWKKQLKEKHGLSLGFNATVLGQYSGDGLEEDDTAAGGIYRLQGSWIAVGRGTENTGSLAFRFEYRRKIGPIGPSDFSSELGVGPSNTGFAYSRAFSPDLSVFSWTQIFAKGRAGFIGGRLDFAALLDPYPYQTFARGFINRAFVYNPTAGTTGVGALGAGVKGFVSENVWLGGVFYDGNAASGDFDQDTFDAGELLKQAEIGWTPSFAKRKTDKVQLTYWHKDARPAAGATQGNGWLLTANTQVAKRYLLFLRAGASNGGAGVPAERSVSIGLGITNRYDELSLGLGWSKPSEETFGKGLQDEYAFEASYRLQLSPNFTLMPDLQVVFNPARNPDESRVLVLGLRARWDV